MAKKYVGAGDLLKKIHPSHLALGVLALLLLISLISWLFVRYPRTVLPSLTLTMFFRIPIPLGREVVYLLVPFYLILASALIATVLFWKKKDLKVDHSSPFFVAILFFIALNALSLFYTGNFIAGLIRFLCFYVPFSLFFYLVWAGTDEKDFMYGIYAILSWGVVNSLLAIYQHFSRSLIFNPHLYESYARASTFRVNGLLWDPNMLGRLFIISILFLIPVIVSNFRSNDKKSSLFLAFLGLFSIGLLFTYSRSSWLALSFGLIVLSIFMLKKKWVFVLPVAATLPLFVLRILSSPRYSLPTSLTGLKAWNSYLEGRLYMAISGFNIFYHFPLLGVGLGAFSKVYGYFMIPGANPALRESHTTLITVLAELGIVGLVATAYLFFNFLERKSPSPTRTDQRVIYVAAFSVVIALIVHSMFYNSLFEDPLLWFSMGLIAVLGKERAYSKPDMLN